MLQNPFCTMFSNDSCSCSFLPSQSAHRARKGFAMGATTKSITGLFANVCGRIRRLVREQTAAGHGTRSAATQGYLLLSLSCLRPIHGGQFSRLAGFPGWIRRDQARWLLKRLGGQLSSALPNMSGLLPSTSGVLRTAGCPARPRSQAAATHRRPAIPRLIARNPTWLPWPGHAADVFRC